MNPFPTFEVWPGNYVDVWQWRQRQVLLVQNNPVLIAGLFEYYRTRPIEFIEHWCDTYDPRNAGMEGLTTHMPFMLFPKQREFVMFLYQCVKIQNDGLVEKCRDMGATWLSAAFSVWLWLFWPGAAVGWGSRKEDLVDKLGDPDSIFEKIRMLIRGLPSFFMPEGFSEREHMTFMKVINPKTEATITGESGDNIGRGGRKLIYFKDESAHYERPERIEAALGDNTRVQIDISSVNGLGNVFHRNRESGVVWSPFIPIRKGKKAVFIFDWRDHPHKTDEWFEQRKADYKDRGLLHLFAQEVERNYAAAVVGVIMKAEWVNALVNAHKHPKLAEYSLDDGAWMGSIDVADEGGDLNAFVGRKGQVAKKLSRWGDGDTGFTTRQVVNLCTGLGEMLIQYDSVGVGAGVKAESNRLAATPDAQERMKYLTFIPWAASGKVLNPEGRLVPKDRQSPMNKDYYQNIKVQAWCSVAARAEYTYRVLYDPDFNGEIDPTRIISIDPTEIAPEVLHELKKELGQVTGAPNVQTGKFQINKKPEGTKSPNLADSFVMNYFPIPHKKYNILALT